MNAAELVERFRADIDDVALPYLWSDAELYSYLDSAQKTFCRKTQGIPDVLTLTLVASTEWYERDPRIRKIRGATRSVSAGIGRRIDVWDYATQRAQCDYFDSRSGPINDLVDGQRKGYLRAYPIPNAAGTVELSVYRLPDTIEEGSEAELEIDEEHHLFLTEGMFALAYRKHDAETFDPKKAATYDKSFSDYCFQAKQEQERNEFQPGTVAYGGYPL